MNPRQKPQEDVLVTQEDISHDEVVAWLTEHCGRGLPYDSAHDLDSALHGAAYTVRQIEGTSSYKVHIGQAGPASSGIRWLLEYVARNELTQTRAYEAGRRDMREAAGKVADEEERAAKLAMRSAADGIERAYRRGRGEGAQAVALLIAHLPTEPLGGEQP